MKAKLVAAFFVTVLLAFTSCKQKVISGSGTMKKENRTVQNFTAIEIDASLKSSITVDSTATASLELNGDENLLPYIKSEMKGNVLHIYTDRPIDLELDKDIVASITTPMLTGLTISGMGESELHGIVRGDQFVFALKGAGDVTIDNIDVNKFDADMAGAGSLVIQNGRMGFANYKLAGAGSVEALTVACDESKAILLGAGDLKLNVAQRLDAEIKGAGSISYKGHPVVTKRVMGVGSIDEVN